MSEQAPQQPFAQQPHPQFAAQQMPPQAYAGQPYGAPGYAPMYAAADPRYKRMNKHLFVWLGAFLFGAFGVDRFMRGQVGLGIFKLLIGSWATLGIWPLVDWIVAIVKAYGGAYTGGEDIIFDAAGQYIR